MDRDRIGLVPHLPGWPKIRGTFDVKDCQGRSHQGAFRVTR